MFPNGITQIVRASIARTKDAALRDLGAGTAHSASSTAGANASGKPVQAVDPVNVRPESLQGASQAIRQALAQRHGTTALIVASLGGQRYLVDIGGEQAALVLETSRVAGSRGLLPEGAEVRLMLGAKTALPTADDRTQAELSASGRLIATLSLNDASGLGRGATDPGRIVTTQPLIEPHILEGADGTATLAKNLASALDRSGLFYESHVAQWSAGARPIDTLRQEPQSQWPRDGVNATATLAASAANTASIAATVDSHTLMREQLQTLASQTIAWQGPVWPHQAADLEIHRDAEDDADPATRTWRAKLALELPALGRVEVKLALTGNQLHLRLGANETAALDALMATAKSLTARLDARGLHAQTLFEPPAATAPAAADASS